jgi:hypothetical protein
VPNPAHFPTFLNGLPRLSQLERDSLEVPFTLPELAAAVDEAAANKTPGLDGLSYEFYRATLPLVGPPSLLPLMPCWPMASFPLPFAVAWSASFPKSLPPPLLPNSAPLLSCLLTIKS